jgi:hypothetical protein
VNRSEDRSIASLILAVNSLVIHPEFDFHTTVERIRELKLELCVTYQWMILVACRCCRLVEIQDSPRQEIMSSWIYVDTIFQPSKFIPINALSKSASTAKLECTSSDPSSLLAALTSALTSVSDKLRFINALSNESSHSVST